MSRDPAGEQSRRAAFNAENLPHHRSRVTGQIRAALKGAGLDIYPACWDEILTELVLVEVADARCRLAEMLLAVVAGARCEADQERLHRMVYVVLNHKVEPDGEITVPQESLS